MDEARVNRICEQLLHAGWRLVEIERLWTFLCSYVQEPMDQAELDIRHLEFIRWLVLMGELGG